MKGCLIDLPLFLPSEKLFENESYKLLTTLLKNMQNIKNKKHPLENNYVVIVLTLFKKILNNMFRESMNSQKNKARKLKQ